MRTNNVTQNDVQQAVDAMNKLAQPQKDRLTNFSVESPESAESSQDVLIATILSDSLAPIVLIDRRQVARRRPSIQHKFVPSSLLRFDDECNLFDIEANMKAMDKMYNATFSDFIRAEQNFMIVAKFLTQAAQDYSVVMVANALRFIMDGWRLESCAKLIKLLTANMDAGKSGLLVNFLVSGWTVVEESSVEFGFVQRSYARVTFPLSTAEMAKKLNEPNHYTTASIERSTKNAKLKLIAIVCANETAESCAHLVNHLTSTANWSVEAATELVNFLDTVLEWDEYYFKEFTQAYQQLVGSQGKVSMSYLAQLYRTNLAMVNYRVAVADYNLALARVTPRQPILVRIMPQPTAQYLVDGSDDNLHASSSSVVTTSQGRLNEEAAFDTLYRWQQEHEE